MKKALRFAVLCFVALFAVISFSFPAFAVTNMAGNKVLDGVHYKLSDDKSYYIVVGGEELPELTVRSTVDGIPVTTIGQSAFHNCDTLNSINIPASVTVIESSAFRNCSELISISLPSGITSLPEDCFLDCRMLMSITLPESLVSIGDQCFKNCKMLGKLKIPASVNEIGHDAFLNCERLLLDVSGNSYAKEYAQKENLNTDFKNSSAYFFLVTGIGIAVCALAVFFISIPVKRHIKKHPSHNPEIYIGRFFGHIGAFISFIIGKVKTFFIFLANKVVKLLELISEKIKQKRRKKLEKDSEDEDKND